ncbi:MAG: prolyl oligopeptidase family serine peptidase [Candidatus Taylorbacteria bacterium]|nr:prolyl oligopeptidase family serine peptidase [Candidatus Taylorbacteria bacterium]
MIIYRLKSKQIIYDLYLPEKPNGKAILYVPGLPGHPRKKNLGETFSTNGFTFFEMRFPGSWESDGVFTMNNCVTSLAEAYMFIKEGAATELCREAKKEWAHNEVIIMGSSFGGGVMLSSNIPDQLTYVLLAPVTRLKDAKDSLVILPSGNDDLYNLLRQGYSNVYRGLTEKDWHDFLNGNTSINPESNLSNLKNKRLLFIQGTSDKTILMNNTADYVKTLQTEGIDAKIITISEAGHGGDLEDKSIELLLKMLQ